MPLAARGGKTDSPFDRGEERLYIVKKALIRHRGGTNDVDQGSDCNSTHARPPGESANPGFPREPQLPFIANSRIDSETGLSAGENAGRIRLCLPRDWQIGEVPKTKRGDVYP